MIPANELRLGNWVNTDILGDCYVIEIGGGTGWVVVFKNTGNSYTITSQNLNPIPITPEILERFGLKLCYKSPYTLRYELESNTKIGAGWNLVNNHFSVRYNGEHFTHIKYLHQFQNWCFFNTGQELELTELQTTNK